MIRKIFMISTFQTNNNNINYDHDLYLLSSFYILLFNKL